jgi:broad specificity phosphatase PhoE
LCGSGFNRFSYEAVFYFDIFIQIQYKFWSSGGLLNTLIFARHGEYVRRSDQLTEIGKQQIVNLCERLRPHLKGEVAVFSSNSLRAWESAGILAEGCEAILFVYPEFSALEGYNPEQALRILERQKDIEVGIVMTDFEFIEMFTDFLAEHAKFPDSIKGTYLSKGEAMVIDIPTGSVDYYRLS